MSHEKFSLKWHDFERNVSNCFVQLRQVTRLSDVTLVGNDHHQVSAHKLVLSASSDIFKEIFQINGSSNLVLYLDSVDSTEINLILDYIYLGEVMVSQEQLERFLKAANKFKLNGVELTDKEYTVPDDVSTKLQGNEEDKLKNEPNQYDTDSYAEIEEGPSSKKFSETKLSLSTNQLINSAKHDVENKFLELIVKEDNTFRCTVCNKCVKHRNGMRRHLESHLSGLSFECHFCGKSFRSSTSLFRHNSRYHFTILKQYPKDAQTVLPLS